ncbi:hypothetical protein C9926_02710 [Sulfurovum lithotrophicum]|nr:hypothetical protein C9926_02710 [Sulfurovum lithotrophicum]
MDKTRNITFMTAPRKGFALIITLSVLSVVIALTVVLLSYFNEVKDDADTTKALIQADVYYSDIVGQLNAFKKKKSLFTQLYRFPISLVSPDKRFSLTLRCKPISSGVNINWLALSRSTDKQHLFQESQRLFDMLVQAYDLEDADRLLEMILEEIGTGRKFVKQEQSRLIQKNGIISYQQFSEIISRYEMEVDDLKVARVPWHKYFSFSKKSEKIDAEYSSAELISFLFDIDLRTVQEWLHSIDKTSLKIFVSDNARNYNEKKNLLADGTFLGESRCIVSYGAGYKFTFDYIQGEAKYFEFYGKH